jgi:hypothetical protein
MPRRNVTTSIRAGVLMASGGTIFAILLAELAIRALSPPAPRARITEPPGYPPIQNIAGNLYVYEPGVRWAHVYDVAAAPRAYLGAEGRIAYRTNNLGLRGDDVAFEKAAGGRRILCLGDSVTFGEGVREEDTWPAQLARRLGPGTEVINAGIQGYDFNHEALYLLLHGRRLAPDVVVIAFFMNDAMQFGATVDHHQGTTEAAHASSALAKASATWRLFERRRRVAERTERYLSDLRESFRGDIWRDVKSRMPKVRELGERDGFRVVAVVFPLLHRLDDYPLAAAHADVTATFTAAGIPVVDLLEPFRAYADEELWVHPVDPHPNEIGHRIAAERLAARPEMEAMSSTPSSRPRASPARRSPR